MKKPKLLIILILVFTMSGCNSENIVENSQLSTEVINTTQKSTGIIETSTTSQETVNTSQESNKLVRPNFGEYIETYREEDGDIVYREGRYDFRIWTPEGREFYSDLLSGRDACIPNKETAIAIASTIFYAQGSPVDKIPQDVFFDIEEELWIVTFFAPINIRHSTCTSIVLKKDTAEVLLIWTEPG